MTVSLCTALPRVVDRRTKNGFPERVAAVEVDGITAQVSQDLLLGSVVLRTRRTRAAHVSTVRTGGSASPMALIFGSACGTLLWAFTQERGRDLGCSSTGECLSETSVKSAARHHSRTT